MISALKQLYEQNHTGDLRALKKAYEQHAEDCAQAAPDDAHYRRCTHL